MPQSQRSTGPSRQDTAAKGRIITPDDSEAWRKVIEAVDSRSRFLCDTWIRLLVASYDFAPRMAILERGEQIVAALPFVEVKSLFTGKRGISLPFIDFCDAYCPQSSDYTLLYNTFVEHGRRNGWRYLETRGNFEQTPATEASLEFYTHVVDLRTGTETVFNRLASSAQRAIRRARKEGVQIDFSHEEQAIRTYYELQCQTRKRHGLPPQPYSFFRNLHRQIIETGEGFVVTGSYRGKPIAGAVYIKQSDVIHYKYGASDMKYQNARANNLVMWSAIEWAAKNGFTEMHLGRNSINNHGLRKYKLTWGATEGRASYHRYNLKTNQIAKMTDDVYGWHNQIFARLPQPLAKLAGSLLYKHIA